MPELRLVYDFADRFPRVGDILFPLPFVGLGFGILYYHKYSVNRDETSMFGINKRAYGIFFGILFTSLAGLISVFVIPASLSEYFKTREVYDDQQYQVVEGKVEHYHAMPEGGHDTERFNVKGISFEYSDYDLTDYGYNNAASKGGVIRENLYVRVTYFNNGDKNVILKLETE